MENINEVIKGGEYIVYHGSDTKITKFTDEFVGGENAQDREGPGIYFSTDELEARHYGKYLYKVKLRPRKLIDESRLRLNKAQALKLIKSAPNWKMTAQNWDENYNRGVLIALSDFVRYNEKEKDFFQQIWYDFYRQYEIEFVRAMVSIGYDGEYVNKANNASHIIVYNPEIIEILESNINEEGGASLYMGNDGLVDESANYSINSETIKTYPVEKILESYKILKDFLSSRRIDNKVNYISDEEIDDILFNYQVVGYNYAKLLRDSDVEYFDLSETINQIKKYLKDRNKIREDRKIDYMPDSSRVKVKSKCVIGGNGDGTSTACNQGDINNLELKKMNENEVDINEDKEFITYNNERKNLEAKRKEYENMYDDEFNKIVLKYIGKFLNDRDKGILLSKTTSAYNLRDKFLEKLTPEEMDSYKKEMSEWYEMTKKYSKFFLKKLINLDNRYRNVYNNYGLKGDKNSRYLYHTTLAEYAIEIIDEDEIWEGEEGGVATTTNKDLIKKIQPIFYHPSYGGEGKTYKNLSTTFVLDFNKIKQDGVKYVLGHEEYGTHWGEEEIRLFPSNGKLPLLKYLVSVIYDPSKEKNKETEKELINKLKEKNIKYYTKGSVDESFINENDNINQHKNEYGCLMVDFSFIKNWSEITSMINQDDIYNPNGEYGVEDKPHVTILYGFLKNITSDDILEMLSNKIDFPIKIQLKSISIFENNEFDVVKFDIVSPQLREINKIISKLPHVNEFDEYNPHMTIAYVNKGEGNKYIRNFKTFQEFESYRLYFTDIDNNATYFTSNDLTDNMNEEIDADTANTYEGSIDSLINGDRGIAFVSIDDEQEKERLINMGFNLIKIYQNGFGYNNNKHIVFGDRQKANKLYDFLVKNGGFLEDHTPEEARYIGELLGYSNESILNYINDKYEKKN